MPKLPASVDTKKLAVGLGVGLVAAAGIRYVWGSTSFMATYKAKALAVDAAGKPVSPVLAAVNNNLPAVGAGLAALALYFGYKRKSAPAAVSLALGAVAAGVAIGGLGVLQTLNPKFKGLQTVRLGSHRYGALLASEGSRPGFGALLASGQSDYQTGYNAAAFNGSGRRGTMNMARSNPRLGALLAQHAALTARSLQ
jgi:hypothetical protein